MDFDGIAFSLERDEVWANWPGTRSPVKLGARNEVEAMMRDFLEESRLADQLVKNHDR